MKKYTVKTLVKDNQGNTNVVGELQTDNLMQGMELDREYPAGRTRHGEEKFMIAILN